MLGNKMQRERDESCFLTVGGEEKDAGSAIRDAQALLAMLCSCHRGFQRYSEQAGVGRCDTMG